MHTVIHKVSTGARLMLTTVDPAGCLVVELWLPLALLLVFAMLFVTLLGFFMTWLLTAMF